MMKNALSKLPRLRPLALWSIVLFSSWVGHVVAADVAKSSAERLAELRNEARSYEHGEGVTRKREIVGAFQSEAASQKVTIDGQRDDVPA